MHKWLAAAQPLFHASSAAIRIAAAALTLSCMTFAMADANAEPAAKATIARDASPAPSPTPRPFTYNGYFRSYYLTRQNASNNIGTQFDSTPGAKYNANAVNQASWNSAIDIHGDYRFPGSNGWSIGGTYLYANPMNGPCVVASNHAKNASYPSPSCVTQVPPSNNPDDTLPGFTMSTLYEAYIAYKAYGVEGTLGNQLLVSPFANPADGRLKPVAFQGADFAYSGLPNWTFEAADIVAFEDRTSSAFSQQTMLTSYPAGGAGLPANLYVPGGKGIVTNGFTYAKIGYASKQKGFSANGYFYGVSDLVNMWWFDGAYTFDASTVKPSVAVQGGTESNTGSSYLGKVSSQAVGAEIGANVAKGVRLTAGFEAIPSRSDTVFLPKGVACNNSSNQITAKGATLAYFLPVNAPQCFTSAGGATRIYYGGWASPYTDSMGADPFFTTGMTQGMADRRSPGTSLRFAATFTSKNERVVLTAGDSRWDYGNALGPEKTHELSFDAQYHLSAVEAGRYRGLLLRYRYAMRTLSNTYCGAAGTNCVPGTPINSAYLGGLPLFKYNRAQLEYDF
jgi:hypothetical protein